MTGKPLEIIVDESLYDLPEVNELVEQGHTIKKLKDLGYDGILGPKASNLTAADIKANPKLLEIAITKFKELKYPKDVKPAKVKKVKVNDGVDNQEAPAGTPAEALPAASTKRKRGPRKAKPVVEGSVSVETGGGAVDTPTQPPTDSTGE